MILLVCLTRGLRYNALQGRTITKTHMCCFDSLTFTTLKHATCWKASRLTPRKTGFKTQVLHLSWDSAGNVSLCFTAKKRKKKKIEISTKIKVITKLLQMIFLASSYSNFSQDKILLKNFAKLNWVLDFFFLFNHLYKLNSNSLNKTSH